MVIVHSGLANMLCWKMGSHQKLLVMLDDWQKLLLGICPINAGDALARSMSLLLASISSGGLEVLQPLAIVTMSPEFRLRSRSALRMTSAPQLSSLG